jgi:hypothetical protein
MKLKPWKSIFRESYKKSILPIGVVNLQTGSSKYFNVYETWDDSTGEIWKKQDGKYIIIFTSGKKPNANKGDKQSFQHDQTMRYLFDAEFIDFAFITNIKSKLSKYGKSLNGYVYK